MEFVARPKKSFNKHLHYKYVDNLLNTDYIKLIHNLLILIVKSNHNTKNINKLLIDSRIEKLVKYIETNKYDKTINRYVFFYEKLGFETTKLVIAFEILYNVTIHDLGNENNYLSSQLFTVILKNTNEIQHNEYSKISKECQINLKDYFNGKYKIKEIVKQKINKICIIKLFN